MKFFLSNSLAQFLKNCLTKDPIIRTKSDVARDHRDANSESGLHSCSSRYRLSKFVSTEQNGIPRGIFVSSGRFAIDSQAFCNLTLKQYLHTCFPRMCVCSYIDFFPLS